MIETEARDWASALEPADAEAARATGRALAVRLRDQALIDTAIATAKEQSTVGRANYWPPYGLGQGWAGLAIACGYLDACFPDEGWAAAGHAYLSRAAEGSAELDPLPPGLWSGLGGLAFATWYLSRGGTRYHKLLATIDALLLPQATARAGTLGQQRAGVVNGLYDLISGVAGVAGALLLRAGDPAVAPVLAELVAALVALSEEAAGLPRWHSPPALLDPYMLESFPHGNLNCGLAHGIPGPLAVLALARRAGVPVAGLEEAIDRIAAWLARHTLEDAWGINWPTAISLDPTDGAGRWSRSAWCYGSAGVARAVWLAGEALDHPGFRALALEAMAAIYRRPLVERRVESPTFCHGVAGLLQVTLRFAHDTGLPQFRSAAGELTRQLLALQEPASLLGYRSLEQGGVRVDQPGLLDGAPGVALVLLAAAGGAEPAWDRICLLS